MKFAVAVALLVILVVVSATSADIPNFGASEEVLDAAIGDSVAELTEKDFSAVPFDPAHNAEDREIANVVMANKEFGPYRANRAQMEYQMTVADYDRQHAAELNDLLTLAKSEGIAYSIENDQFEPLLNRIDAHVESVQLAHEVALEAGGNDGAVQDQAQVQGVFNIFKKKKKTISKLRKVVHIFKTRISLRSAIFDDILHFSIGSLLQKGLNALARVVMDKKCSWCQGIAAKIKGKLCDAAGSYICKLAANACNAVVPGAGVVLAKFACGSPIKLANLLSHWCVIGIEKLQQHYSVTDTCLCSKIHGPTITIPAIKIPLICHTTKVTIPVGDLCAKPAQCI